MEDYKIRFENICMEFPGVKALDRVSFGILPGTVHVLMGENGAGKSTLMKILSGVQQQTDGKFYVDNKECRFRNQIDAEKNGIAMIYQELSYMPDISVERYLMINHEAIKGGFVIDWKETGRRAQEILDRENLDYDRKEVLKNLSVSDIQLLEIVREISIGGISVLIMDEPTSALSDKEVDRLFHNIDELKKKGLTIIYISHKMDEVFRVADYITVMRDGQHIKTAPASEYTQSSLVELMVGRSVSDVYPKKEVAIGEELLRVENLSSKENNIHNISFSVHAGEILGLGGLMGAGRTETVRCIYGLDKYEQGEIYVRGKKVKIASVSDAIKNGIVMATEDRRRYGLVLCRSIKENVSLSSLGKISKMTVLNRKKEGTIVQDFVGKMRVKTTGIEEDAQHLSGGNQQKVVLSKCLMTEADVLILDEPTRGIDVGAKYEIYELMVELAKQGKGIIMISSETPEFVGMCDRAVVFYKGRISGELSKKDLNQKNVVNLSVGGKHDVSI